MEFGLQDIKIWDILDVLIVAYLMYIIYKLLRGTRAFYIFAGVVLLYTIYWIVGYLDMKLLSLLLGRVVGFGVIILIIIFQPEIRKFLLVIGNTTLKGRFNFLTKYFNNEEWVNTENLESTTHLFKAMKWLSSQKMGALIVLSKDPNWSDLATQGTALDSEINQQLIESIFFKNSPLHDGAMVISEGRIKAAKAILPVSRTSELAEDFGLRHRAALGASENSDACILIVSEETGEISVALNGKISRNISDERLKQYLNLHI